jgi:hypothetical protein
MPEYFGQLFGWWLLLILVQTAAALPWAIALERRLWALLRRPQVLAMVLGANGVLAFLAAWSISHNAETLKNWGRGYTAFLQLQLSADFFVAVIVLMLQVWPKGGAVALSAFRESIRQPMFLLLVLPTIFFALPLVPALPYFTLGEDIKMVKELGYDLLALLGGIFVVICASTSISDEIEGRTAVTLMSKPIARWQFLMGKFVGILLGAMVMVVLLGWFVVWVFIIKAEWDPPIAQTEVPVPNWVLRYSANLAPGGQEGPAFDIARGMLLWIDEAGAVFPGLVMVMSQVMVLLAIAVAMATRLHFTINFIVCAAFYFLGHLAPVLIAVSQGGLPLVQFMAQVFRLVFPGLEHFDMSGAVVRDVPLPPVDFAWYTANVALYAVEYSAVALLLGLILFEDKDLA